MCSLGHRLTGEQHWQVCGTLYPATRGTISYNNAVLHSTQLLSVRPEIHVDEKPVPNEFILELSVLNINTKYFYVVLISCFLEIHLCKSSYALCHYD